MQAGQTPADLLIIRVQPDAFDIGTETAAFAASASRAGDTGAGATRTGAAGTGAIVTFTGLVRDLPGTPLVAMQIEHYPGMTERAITAIVAEAAARWSLTGALVIHRHGRLPPGAPIMMVATAAAHRAEAFAAADFLMDYLKSRAPFWKQEITATSAAWVAPKATDEAALTRW